MMLDVALATIATGPSFSLVRKVHERLDAAHDLLDTLEMLTLPSDLEASKAEDDEKDGLEVFRTGIPKGTSLDEAGARFDGIVPDPSQENEDGVYMGQGGPKLIYLPLRVQVGLGPQVADVAPSPAPMQLDDAFFIPQDLEEVVGNEEIETMAAAQADQLVDDKEWDEVVEEFLRENSQRA